MWTSVARDTLYKVLEIVFRLVKRDREKRMNSFSYDDLTIDFNYYCIL